MILKRLEPANAKLLKLTATTTVNRFLLLILHPNSTHAPNRQDLNSLNPTHVSYYIMPNVPNSSSGDSTTLSSRTPCLRISYKKTWSSTPHPRRDLQQRLEAHGIHATQEVQRKEQDAGQHDKIPRHRLSRRVITIKLGRQGYRSPNFTSACCSNLDAGAQQFPRQLMDA